MLLLSLVGITVAYLVGVWRGAGIVADSTGRLMATGWTKTKNTFTLGITENGLIVEIEIDGGRVGCMRREGMFGVDEVDDLMALWVKHSKAAERLAQKEES